MKFKEFIVENLTARKHAKVLAARINSTIVSGTTVWLLDKAVTFTEDGMAILTQGKDLGHVKNSISANKMKEIEAWLTK